MEKTQPSRPERLEAWLSASGLPAAAARALSADLVIRHPLVRRIGVRRMARTLRERGLSEQAARGAATLLFALESFDLGATLQQVRAELRIAGVAEEEALGAVYEAARLHRETRRPETTGAPTPRMATVVAVALTAYTLAVSLWLLSGG